MNVINWNCGRKLLDCAEKPLIMGILNVTPDSFSDGGALDGVGGAVARGLEMVAAGADLLDVGGESTRPGADPVSAEEEMARTVPVIRELRQRTDCLISIDTMKPAVAAAALAAGADVINDVTGFCADEMIELAADTGCGCVAMHMRGTPKTMQSMTDYACVVVEVVNCCQSMIARMVAGGIAESAISIDPGIGFGKTVCQNLELLKRLDELVVLGRPVLLGTSRKSFIGKVLAQDVPSDRIWGTAASTALGVGRGAHVFRVHDVAEMRQVVDLSWAICNPEKV